MYRTMEMKAESKLSYTERLVISGSRPKVWFGCFLFTMSDIGDWIKHNLISGILKLLCFTAIILLILGLMFGSVELIIWIWSVRVLGYIVWGIIGTMALFILFTFIKEIWKSISNSLNDGQRRVREAALHKLGQQNKPLCCELYGPPVRVRFQNIDGCFEELSDGRFEELQRLRREGEEQTEHILKELENV